MVLRIFFITVLLFSGCSDPDSINGDGESEEISGKELFQKQCVICHGKDGKLCLSGAPDLSVSKMDSIQIGEIIINGQNSMPGFGPIMPSEKVLKETVEHVKSLSK
jgi:mono/diheme cytochrome c family protein